MLTPPANATCATGSAAGLEVTPSMPVLSRTTACPAALLPKSVPTWAFNTTAVGPQTSKRPCGQGIGVQHLQRTGQDVVPPL